MAEFWTNEKLSELIDLYEQYQCLYNVKHKDYHNRDLRSKANLEIAKAMGCSEKEVKDKIKGLRSQYGREKKKEKKRKTGDGADDIYKSSWVHFSRLKFLDDFVSAKSSRSNLEDDSTPDSESTDHVQIPVEDEDKDSVVSENATSETADSVRSTKRPLKQRETPASKRLREEDIILKKAITCMEKSVSVNKGTARDADEIFGEYVTSELRSIKDENTKRVIKFRIQSLFFSLLTPQQATIPAQGAQQWPDQPWQASTPHHSYQPSIRTPSLTPTDAWNYLRDDDFSQNEDYND